MKWFIPREHGAWAMLIVPYLLGMFSSKVTWLHLLFFVGIFAFYFASAPLLTFVRQPKLKNVVIPSFVIYISIGLIFTLPILYKMPKIAIIGLFIFPFFVLNIYFAKQKKERLFINDLMAITGLSFLVMIAYYIGVGLIDEKVIILMGINIIFFTASVFHVKTLIREKGNSNFLFASNIFHGLSILLFLMLGYPFVAIVFLVSSLKAWFMPKTKRHKPMQIGLIEIANSLVFVITMAIFY